MKRNAKTKIAKRDAVLSTDLLKIAYEPIVRQHLGEGSFLFNVEVELIEHDDAMIMCHVVITPNEGTILLDLLSALKGLDRLCVYSGLVYDHAGRYWLLGDGDDSLAVFFEKGSIRVWLRGWIDHPYTGEEHGQ